MIISRVNVANRLKEIRDRSIYLCYGDIAELLDLELRFASEGLHYNEWLDRFDPVNEAAELQIEVKKYFSTWVEK